MSIAKLRMGLALGVCALVAGLVCVQPTIVAGEPSLDTLASEYAKDVRPVMQRHCFRCHGAKKQEADVDLESIASLADIRRSPKTWQKVLEMLDGGQMPPKEAKQLSDEDRSRLRNWVRAYLKVEAKALAGDPGPVVLRRLSNAEYIYTIRDLTGLDFRPSVQFPVDGAAGEGFTNTGQSLVMSPALLTKYLDAAKELSAHALLLSDGFRWSLSTTRRDGTNEILGQIRDFYREFTDPRGGDKVNLQGIVFATNEGGRLPLEKYLAATLAERESLAANRKSIEAVARERGLNAKYLGILWKSLTSSEPSLLLDGLRARWRTSKLEETAAIAEEIAAWQKGLWRFSTVGHIGKVGGPKRWLEPVNPLVARQDVRFKMPATPDGGTVTLTLVAADAGDGNDHDYVIWQQPRLVAPGRPDLLLRDVREVSRELLARRERVFADTAKYLSAAAEASAAQGKADAAKLAEKHGIEADALRAWLDYLGIGAGESVRIDSHFTKKITSAAGYDFIKGWGSHDTPLLVANSSDQHVRIPGNMKPHSLAVHPSPTLQAVVGWKSPVTATIRLEGKVTHAHPECGNGITWSLELRRGNTRQRLVAGTAQGSKEVKLGPIEKISVLQGDLVSLLIGPRDGNHACDLTALELKLTSSGDGGRTWDLAQDVSADVLAGNPHADRFGNAGVWHFYTEPDKPGLVGPVIPAGSLLAKWQTAQDAGEKGKLAEAVQTLLTSGQPTAKDGPDAAMYRQLASLGGPLFRGMRRNPGLKNPPPANAANAAQWGLDPALFGKHPDGRKIDAGSLCVHAPSVLEVRLPADLAEGCELVTTGVLDPETGKEGSVQLRVVAGKRHSLGERPGDRAPTKVGLLPSEATVSVGNGPWTANNRQTAFSAPILVNEGSAARKRIEAALDEFRQLFPAALCYTKIVPVDEVVTLTQYYREDDHLVRLMLDDVQKARLNRLWDELHYVSRDPLTQVDALEQLIQYATQDADPKVFIPLRKPFKERADAFRQRLIDTQSRHVDSLLEFASRAYRRPLTDAERQQLLGLYHKLRAQELPHEEAIRLTLARVLVSPAFLYRMEDTPPGKQPAPVSDWELANRLSYFLWSSMPDAELRDTAAAGKLHNPDVLVQQARRMLKDARVRRLATEFGCQWLHVYGFDTLDEKSERHFPSFVGLRGEMYEESIRFLTDLFQSDASVLSVLDADHTFLNESLARHYGIPGVTGPEWRRLDGIRKYGRGGILGLSTTLAKQSGASRTSPILRGTWVSEVLLGEKLPRPPKDVPRLPEDETATEGLTVRQLVEKHSSDPRCAVCHTRFDAYGFALEGFDAIGRRRDKDLSGRPIDSRAKLKDGKELDGLDGLRQYLLNQRRDDIVRQFCRKLLGYALARGVQLSDEPLLDEMDVNLKKNGYRFSAAIETIMRSPQFRMIRGKDAKD